LSSERVDDVERRRRRVDVSRERLRAALECFERIRERRRAAEELGSGRIGEVLALPRDSQLQQRRGERCKDDGPDKSDPAEWSAVVLVASEEQRELEEIRDRRDRARHHRDDRGNEGVAVLDVTELVREDALDLVERQPLEQALRDRDRRVLWVATGGERVGLLRTDGVQPRHGKLGAPREVPHHRLEVRPGARLDLTRAADPECEPVGEPVGADVHRDGEDDEDIEPYAADERADPDEQRSQAGDQEPRPSLGRETLGTDVHRGGLLPNLWSPGGCRVGTSRR
jgi:hypothetical protein